MSKKGYLAVANIVGYESFLILTEIEHAQSIVNDLLTTIINNINSPLTFFKLEGNSVYIYNPEGNFINNKTMLEVIENIYYKFARTLETMSYNTVCTCQACRDISALDLKFLIHFGTYSNTEIDGKEDLIGPDVLFLRELVRSNIDNLVDTTAYVFLTEASIEALELNTQTEGIEAYSASFEDIGEINGFVQDLHPLWERERRRNVITVCPDETWFEVEADFPVCAALAWEYVTAPEFRRQWLSANKVTAYTNDKGRVGFGTTYICAHGKYEINQIIIDWCPFEYLTVDTLLPMKGSQRHAIELSPNGDNTRVLWRFSRAKGQNWLHTFMLRLLLTSMKSKLIDKLRQGRAKVLQIIEQDQEIS